jgi:hypothetical protein
MNRDLKRKIEYLLRRSDGVLIKALVDGREIPVAKNFTFLDLKRYAL